MIQILKREGYRIRIRIVQHPSDPGWAESVRPGRDPWCEMVVYADTTFVGAYGGEVWPTAWPELFQAIDRRGGIRATPTMMEILK